MKHIIPFPTKQSDTTNIYNTQKFEIIYICMNFVKYSYNTFVMHIFYNIII